MTWNSLVSAFGSRDMDGAYQVWLQMQRSGAVPDHVTLKALATAFEGNATLANELVQEAADARASLLQGGPEVQLPPGIAYLLLMQDNSLAARWPQLVCQSNLVFHACLLLVQMLPVGHGRGLKQRQQEQMLQGYTAAGQQSLARPFLLDLHGLSASAARMALLKVVLGHQC